LVNLDCHGDGDSKHVGAAIPDAELKSVEHVVGLEEITDPSLEPLLQEVSSKVNLESVPEGHWDPVNSCLGIAI
jgi:hypothetical protein